MCHPIYLLSVISFLQQHCEVGTLLSILGRTLVQALTLTLNLTVIIALGLILALALTLDGFRRQCKVYVRITKSLS